MQTLGWMNAFEKITKTRLKDCFSSHNRLCFVVQNGQLYKALGPKSANIKKLEGLFKQKIKIIEYDDDVLKFVVNVLAPLKVVEIKNEDSIITITGPDQKTKGLMIGAKAANLRGYEKIVQKFFPDTKELKVI
jgi:N utilization substance protein A